jgi:LmbE family N-acetylglucosaminyl deacetylase
MARLGADYRLLAWLDCIYREGPERGVWYYNSAPEIFGEVQPDDWPLAAEIAAALVELIPNKDTVTIYAPLTVGHHVDHQLTHKAAWQLREQGYSVAFYEDYPYVDPRYPFTHLGAGNTYNLAAALAALRPAQLNPQLHLISEENLRAKIDSIRAYSSQLPVLFGGEEAMAKYVREYALYVGEGNPAERIWTPAGRVGR